MIVYSSLAQAREGRGERSDHRPVVTAGFFDGLHKGHQKLLADLRDWAECIDRRGTPMVLTFDPHPQAVIRGSGPPMIHSLAHRLLLLEREGIESCLVLPFSVELSKWTPEEFVERILVDALGSRHLLMGFDGAIGYKRHGTFEYLSAKASSLGIEVRQSSPLVVEGQRISSTLVREAIHKGELEDIRELTGRQYAVLGKVIGGDRRGRELGFPTANLELNDVDAMLPNGVYFAYANRVDSDAGLHHPAIVNLGRRPTFESEACEVGCRITAGGVISPYDVNSNSDGSHGGVADPAVNRIRGSSGSNCTCAYWFRFISWPSENRS